MNKCAIITGTSSGVGFKMCQSLLDMGYVVHGLSRNETPVENENFYDYECDLRIEENVAAVIKEISRDFSNFDLVVNNAGICSMDSLLASSAKDFFNHFESNVFSAYCMLKYCSPFLGANSHVVNILSTAAKIAFPNIASYNTAKFAMKGLVESVQKEWEGRKIKFSNLYPGAIDTPLWDKIGIQVDRAKMMSPEDFISIFELVIKSSPHVQIPDLTFYHKDGVLE